MDLFQGQLRSEVKCPECSKESVKFDPMRSVSLSLPQKERTLSVTFVPEDIQKPFQQIDVKVPLIGEAARLAALVSTSCKVRISDFCLIGTEEGRFSKWFVGRDRLEHIKNSEELFVYEIKHNPLIVLQRIFVKCALDKCAHCGKTTVRDSPASNSADAIFLLFVLVSFPTYNSLSPLMNFSTPILLLAGS